MSEIGSWRVVRDWKSRIIAERFGSRGMGWICWWPEKRFRTREDAEAYIERKTAPTRFKVLAQFNSMGEPIGDAH